MKGFLIFTLIVLILILLGGGAYMFVPEVKTMVDQYVPTFNLGGLFGNSAENVPDSVSPSSGQGISMEEFQATLGRLQTVEAQLGDQSILNDSRFTSLVDFSVEPRPEPIGNKIPFVAPPEQSGSGRP